MSKQFYYLNNDLTAPVATVISDHGDEGLDQPLERSESALDDNDGSIDPDDNTCSL